MEGERGEKGRREGREGKGAREEEKKECYYFALQDMTIKTTAWIIPGSGVLETTPPLTSPPSLPLLLSSLLCFLSHPPSLLLSKCFYLDLNLVFQESHEILFLVHKYLDVVSRIGTHG